MLQIPNLLKTSHGDTPRRELDAKKHSQQVLYARGRESNVMARDQPAFTSHVAHLTDTVTQV